MDHPKYQQLKPEQQQKLRDRYYDKYVAPQYAAAKLPVPDKATWTAGVTQKNNITGNYMFGPENYYDNQAVDHISRIGFAAAKNVGDILHGTLSAGVWISKQASLAQLGLSDFFTHPTPEQQASSRQALDNATKYAQKVVDKVSYDVIQNSNFWMQTHPSKTFVERADSFVGEQLVQLPLYSAIGEARALGVTKNLTQALAASKTSRIVAGALGSAADAFIGSVAQGQSKEETAANMAAFMGFGAFADGAKVAGSALIKKFIAHTVASGGRPLAEAASNEAIHELENNMIHGEAAPPNTKIESQHVADALERAKKDDPVKVSLVTGYKAVVNSISQSNFGKSFKELSAAEKNKVRQFHAELTQDAVREMPAHMPETSKANAKATVKEGRELNPRMAQWEAQMAQKHGVNFEESLHEAEQESVKQQTGIKSSQGTTKKIATATSKVDTGNSKRLARAQEEEPRRFAQMKIEHLAYFRNPVGKSGKRFDFNKWLNGMDSQDFISELRDHIGNQWFFEKPQHLLEYGLTYSNEMPKAFKNRILEELQDIDPTGTPSEWLGSAKKRDKHLENMATTGRLWAEGNIFRSSRFTEGSRATKWQSQLNKEAEAIKKNERNNLKAKMKPAQTHYKAADDISQNILKHLQEESE